MQSLSEILENLIDKALEKHFNKALNKYFTKARIISLNEIKEQSLDGFDIRGDKAMGLLIDLSANSMKARRRTGFYRLNYHYKKIDGKIFYHSKRVLNDK